MGALKINCYCNEYQMENILKYVSNRLSETDRMCLCDIDEEIGSIRICVDFEVFMDKIEIKAAEVLDNDWEPLFEDSAVFYSRLRPIVKEYNRQHRQAMLQAIQIRLDQYY